MDPTSDATPLRHEQIHVFRPDKKLDLGDGDFQEGEVRLPSGYWPMSDMRQNSAKISLGGSNTDDLEVRNRFREGEPGDERGEGEGEEEAGDGKKE